MLPPVAERSILYYDDAYLVAQQYEHRVRMWRIFSSVVALGMLITVVVVALVWLKNSGFILPYSDPAPPSTEPTLVPQANPP
jgi:hypothetical protein